jgi:predicted DNA-binding transcriptional regulator AlpA
MSQQFLCCAEVCQILHLSRSRLYQLIEANQFPRPHKLSAGKSGRIIWPAEIVHTWVASRAPQKAGV